MSADRGTSKRQTALSVAIAGMLSGAWSALTAAEGSDDTLREIVVTARKRVENVQDVPQDIAVFTAHDLEHLGIVRVEDLATLVPSISLISTGPGGQRIFIRGVSDGSSANYGFANTSTTRFLIDDLAFDFYGHDPDLHLYDIERIEVLNGPQGTLFGPGALSGAVRVITQKPDPEASSAGVDLDGGQFQGGGRNWAYEAFANLPLIAGSTALRVSAYSVRDGGYIDNVLATRHWLNGTVSSNVAWVENDWNTRDILGGRVALSHELGERWHLLLTAFYQQQHFRGSWEDDSSYVGRRELQRFSPEGGYNYFRAAALHLEGDVGIADLVYAGGYSDQQSRRLYDFSDYAQYSYYSSFVQPLTCLTDPSSGSGNHGCKPPYMYGDVHGVVDRWSHELRLQSKSGGRAHWTVGAYWEQTLDPNSGFEHLPNINLNGAPARAQLEPGAAPLQGELYSDSDHFDYLQSSEFGDVTVDLDRRWALEAGIEHFRSHQSDAQAWSGYFFQAKIPRYEGLDAAKSNFKVGINFKPAPRLLLYFSYAQGVRDGSFNFLPVGFNNPTVPKIYTPDTLNNFELGLKGEYWEGRLILNSALYYMHWRNYQVPVSVPYPPYGFNANIGDARIVGFESSLEWQPLESLYLSVDEDYNDARLVSDDFENPSYRALPGERLPEAPLVNLSAIVRYERSLTAPIKAFAQVDVAHKGAMWNDLRVDVRTMQPGYTLCNLRFGLERPRAGWVAEAYITNLANKRAVIYDNITGYDYYPGHTNPEIAAPPRVFGLRLSYHFTHRG